MKSNRIDNLKRIGEIIKNENNILILPHILPDGDTIGSSIALCMALKSMGKNTVVLLDEDIPDNLTFISDECISKSIDRTFVPDLVVSIDCSDEGRLGNRRKYLAEVSNSINIDHHVTNTGFAAYDYIDPKAAATGEIVFDLIKSLQVSMTKSIATCLFVAISTDTGSFKYDNTSPRTHRIASELLECGIDQNRITTEIYQSKPMNKVKLLAEVLNSLHMDYEGKLAILSLTNEMLGKSKVKVGDADGFIEYARDIQGVEVAVLLKELSENVIKVGFRSKYDVDVSKVAGHFDGGGHKKASGCTIYENIEKAKEIILKTMENYL